MINAIVGSSVFGLPSVIAGRLGSVSPLAWVFAALGSGVIMVCFAEVASRFTEAGGPYLYARVAFGRLVGIEMGWLLYLARVTAAATNANLMVILLGGFWPEATGPVESRVVLAIVIGGLTAINYRGVGFGAAASNVFALAKLIPLGLFLVAGLAFILRGNGPALHYTMATPETWLEAVLLLMFAYGGFEAALMPMAEARNPRRDAPFALFVALGVVTLVYTMTQLIVIHSLADPAATERPVSAAAGVIAGPAGAAFMGVVALISVTGYLAGVTLNVPRLTFAMAQEQDLPEVFGKIHPRFRTPYVSLLCFSLAVWLLAAGGSFLQNLTLSAVSRLITYALICAALVRFRRRDLAPPALFVLPGGTTFAAIGILFSGALATRMSAREGLILVVALILGWLNWMWARSKQRET